MMGLMYAWATKEYLLERMSFGQIMMYLDYGLQIRYPKTDGRQQASPSLVGRSAEEIRRKRDELRRQYGTNVEGL